MKNMESNVAVLVVYFQSKLGDKLCAREAESTPISAGQDTALNCFIKQAPDVSYALPAPGFSVRIKSR